MNDDLIGYKKFLLPAFGTSQVNTPSPIPRGESFVVLSHDYAHE